MSTNIHVGPVATRHFNVSSLFNATSLCDVWTLNPLKWSVCVSVSANTASPTRLSGLTYCILKIFMFHAQSRTLVKI